MSIEPQHMDLLNLLDQAAAEQGRLESKLADMAQNWKAMVENLASKDALIAQMREALEGVMEFIQKLKDNGAHCDAVEKEDARKVVNAKIVLARLSEASEPAPKARCASCHKEISGPCLDCSIPPNPAPPAADDPAMMMDRVHYENHRYRKALEKIAAGTYSSFDVDYKSIAKEMMRLAQEALAPSPSAGKLGGE